MAAILEKNWTLPGDDDDAIDTINAIAEYVQRQRRYAGNRPAALRLIESFEGWVGALDVAHRATWLPHLINAEDAGEAKRRRNAINQAIGQSLPATWKPADRPQTPPDEPKPLLPDLPTFGVGLAIGVVAVLGGLVYVLGQRTRGSAIEKVA